jgi:hypothetical protein
MKQPAGNSKSQRTTVIDLKLQCEKYLGRQKWRRDRGNWDAD